jgi:hypothetical protein
MVFEYLRTDNMGTSVQGEDIPDERLALSLAGDHIRDLNDRIDVGLRKDTLPSGTLDIKAENP